MFHLNVCSTLYLCSISTCVLHYICVPSQRVFYIIFVFHLNVCSTLYLCSISTCVLHYICVPSQRVFYIIFVFHLNVCSTLYLCSISTCVLLLKKFFVAKCYCLIKYKEIPRCCFDMKLYSTVYLKFNFINLFTPMRILITLIIHATLI